MLERDAVCLLEVSRHCQGPAVVAFEREFAGWPSIKGLDGKAAGACGKVVHTNLQQWQGDRRVDFGLPPAPLQEVDSMAV